MRKSIKFANKVHHALTCVHFCFADFLDDMNTIRNVGGACGDDNLLDNTILVIRQLCMWAAH